MMSNAAKKPLHDLIDEMPEDRVPAALHFLRQLRDESPIAAMGQEEREALNASLRDGIRELDEGKGIPGDVVLAELEQYG